MAFNHAFFKATSLILLLLLAPCLGLANEIDLVVVHKSKARLTLKSHHKIIKQYPVVFGDNPIGHKQQEGDERTPEGRYILDYKKADSIAYKSIHISYPNDADKKRAQLQGVDAGGAIMIHGQLNGLGWLSFITQHFNWTNGCIAVTNRQMEEIWQLVKKGTPIEILP
ncbi:MAG: L,D-transpeptidase family protein [Methylococcales bacterium]|nr:L,D-transpeptidase family protein [Methylococcales bacterium]